MSDPKRRGPLDGIKVVDFTRLFAGPLCTMTLADMGAEVVKVEGPGGDDARNFGPPFLGGEGMNFMALNRGKRSVTLDLKTGEGREAVRKLVADADVVVENFRPGVAERLGIGFDELREINPGLVYCSISGFGPAEELGRRPALDIILQALTGVMARQADPDGTPRLLCITVADTYAAAQATQGILAALLVRERGGSGQRVDVSLLEALLTAQAYRVIAGVETMELPAFDDTVPYRAFEASDGDWLVIAVVSLANWQALCEALEDPDLAADERFGTNPDRVLYRSELAEILERHFRTRTRDEWLERLSAGGVPCAPVQDLTDLMRDPAMMAAGVLVELEHPVAGRVRTLGPGIHLSESEVRPAGPAPRLGEHTDGVLRELGIAGADPRSDA